MKIWLGWLLLRNQESKQRNYAQHCAALLEEVMKEKTQVCGILRFAQVQLGSLLIFFSVYQLQSRPFRPQFKVCNKRVNMYRFMVLISILLATVANAMPRYLIVPIENVRFINGPQTQLHHRVQRSAWPQEDA